MKKLLTLLLLTPLFGFSQSICDSIIVDSIFVNVNTNQIEVTVTNNSSEFFSYPGWIIFDAQQDTVAVETVNFFGFAGQTTFTLDIHGALSLPLTGTLNLYSNFYDTLWCTKAITIDSTMLSVYQHAAFNLDIDVFPNPVYDQFAIGSETASNYDFELYNASGQLVLRKAACAGITTIQRDNLASGVYTLVVRHEELVRRFKLLFK